MDRIELFRIFTQVVDCHSFTLAAQKLALPRSSVSAAIMTLEARLGTRLLQRTTRRVAPTLDGLAFYERCQRLVSDVEEIENSFNGFRGQPVGKLRIDVPGRIGRLILAPALGEFLDAYPGIDIDLGVSDRTINLIEEGVDCALRGGILADSTLIARLVGHLPFINVASPAYLSRYGIPLHPENLAQHWAVHYASPTSGRIEPWEWVDGQGKIQTMLMRARLSVNNIEATIASCLSGLGIIQIAAYDARPFLASGELVEIMPECRPIPLPLHLIYPHRRSLSQRLHLFADWLITVLRRDMGEDLQR